MSVDWIVVAGFALAAAVGAIVRFMVSTLANNEFPYGTLAVNLIASCGLGYLVGSDIDPDLFVVVAVAGLGALSTWSTAANEAAEMARRDEGKLAVAYLALMVFTGILMAWIGLQVGKQW